MQVDIELIKWIGMMFGAIIVLGAAYKSLKIFLTEIVSAPMDKKLGEMKSELNSGLESIRSKLELHEERLRREFDDKIHLNMTNVNVRIDKVSKNFNDLDKTYIKKFAETETDLHHTKNYQREIMVRIDNFEKEIKTMISEQGRKIDEYMNRFPVSSGYHHE